MVRSTRWNAPDIPHKTTSFLWDSDHAAWIHENPDRPRPWTDITLANVDVGALFRENYTSPDRMAVSFFNTMEELGELFTLTIEQYAWNYQSDRHKRYSPGYTWQVITDSGELAQSLTITFV